MAPSNRKRGLTPTEEALWKDAMKDARPLSDDKRREQPVVLPKVGKAARNGDAASHRLGMTDAPVAVHRQTGGPRGAQHRPDDLSGLDRRTADRFRKGQMPVEGVLDLHGLNRDEAYGRLNRFIEQASNTGKRCVIVVTGKGGKAEGEAASWLDVRETGVLRAAFSNWLDTPWHRARIVAYTPARPRHGGHGAFYVLLRRQRHTSGSPSRRGGK